MSYSQLLVDNKNHLVRVLNQYQSTWSTFHHLHHFLQESHQQHHQKTSIRELHHSLSQFRNPKGWRWVQRQFHKLTTTTPIEQSLAQIDAPSGDRVFLNQLLLKHAQNASPRLYEVLVEPQLKNLLQNENTPAHAYIPNAIDTLLFTVDPLLVFSLLNDVVRYQSDVRAPTRWLYLQVFIDRWFFKFNRHVLGVSRSLQSNLERTFASALQRKKALDPLLQFSTQQMQLHLDSPNLPLAKERRNRLRVLYIIVLHLLQWRLPQDRALPPTLEKFFTLMSKGAFFAREAYLKDGMRFDYERFHPLPRLWLPTTRLHKVPPHVKGIVKKRFDRFWKHYHALPSPLEKMYWLTLLVNPDRIWALEQMLVNQKVEEFISLHQQLQSLLNQRHGEDTVHLYLYARGSLLMNSLWEVARRYQLASSPTIKTNADLRQQLQQSFSPQLSELEDIDSPPEPQSQSENDWRWRSVQEIPPYSEVRRWKQIPDLLFSVPQPEVILADFLPYLRMRPARLEKHLSLAHCVELCRIPFRFLTTHMEQRFCFHFLTLGDLLLMRLVGEKTASVMRFLEYANESKQILQPEMFNLLKHVYPVLEKQMGARLREQLPFVINHRYAYRGGGLNANHVATALERINAIEDEMVPYLSAGKLFGRLAAYILMQLIKAINQDYLNNDEGVPQPKVKQLFKRSPSAWVDQAAQKHPEFVPIQSWLKPMKPDPKQEWYLRLNDEILTQHQMFFHPKYPNPFLLPTH